MSLLVLVRHGKAGSKVEGQDYDELSEIGHKQSQLLGQYWNQNKITFDKVYSGPRIRQKKTACDVLAEVSGWPDIEVLEELDEYASDQLMAKGLPLMASQDSEVAELAEQYRKAGTGPDYPKAFQRVFSKVMTAWAKGELEMPGVDSWASFCKKVETGIGKMTSEKRSGQRIVAFTSGGPIGVAVQLALQTKPEMTLDVMWSAVNASITEFRFSYTKKGISLNGYNAVPHLEGSSLVTYR